MRFRGRFRSLAAPLAVISRWGSGALVSEPVVRIGYLLVRDDVELPARPGQQYRGIDRLPFVPSPIAAHPAWRAYFDADDSGALAGDLSTAQRIRDQLRAVDTSTEVIYAQAFPLGTVPDVTASPEVADQQSRSLRRISERSAVVGPPDPVFVPIGFDVSIPLPDFHSALFQPCIIEGDHSLNGDGLLDDRDDADRLARLATASRYGLGIFWPIQVLAAPPS